MPSAADLSPFHAGELETQRRVGVDERIAAIGRRVIRDHLLPQHQQFYAAQHQLLLALVDSKARPWVAMVAGAPGFVSALSPTRLRIDALPLAGVPHAAPDAPLVIGDRVGVLGIDYASRRRNRVNGRVLSVDHKGFELQVEQSFGNCPKYIQLRSTRLPQEHGWRVAPVAGVAVGELSAQLRALITQADHFYIASHYAQAGDEARHGADVSHRGGKPGFVRIDADGTLVFPDFAGNRFYNTLGNIAANGTAALLFIDFDTGSLLSMTGTASVDWRDASASGFAGAERLLRFRHTAAWLYPHALPFTWQLSEQSPALANTGLWS